MRLAYFGSGYVGQVNAAVQASKGHEVILVDINEEIIKSINNGEPTIYEKGLNELINETVNKGSLTATSDFIKAVKQSEVIFICVGTPSNIDGSINLRAIKSVSKNIGLAINESSDYKVVVVKSTVLPWIPERIVARIIKEQTSKPFGLVMNPEFLKEGVAVNDCLNPDSIVIGGSERDVNIVKKVYDWSSVKPSITGIKEASLIKYAKNSFLATKISFANIIANYCDEHGINSREVLRVMSEDNRISSLFLEPGPGFGGSCFPKDVNALNNDMNGNQLLSAVLKVNEGQYKQLIRIAEQKGLLKGVIAVLGLSFKPNTDDVRESPSIKLIRELQSRGFEIRVYDPEAMINAEKELMNVTFTNSVNECVNNASLIFIPVPWKEFNNVRDYSSAPIIQGHQLIIGDNVFTIGDS